MRKTFGLILFACLPFTLVFAQRGTVIYPNEVKVHLFDMIYGNYAVQYDHFIGRFSSVQAGARFIFGKPELEFDTTEFLSKIGGGVQFGWRYYLGSSQYNREPRGAYFETRLKVNYTHYQVHDKINGGVKAETDKIYAQLNFYGGLEVVIFEIYCIDMFAGPGIGNGRLCFPDPILGEYCERETEMFHGFFGTIRGNRGDTSLGVRMDGGISVGILF